LDSSSPTKAFNWIIDWGDGSIENRPGNNTSGTAPLEHTYFLPGNHMITIMPGGTDQAWLGPFGFSSTISSTGVNSQANRNKVVSVNSKIYPLMTRTEGQINGISDPPDYEWAYTFNNCKNDAFAMGPEFGFDESWDGITKVSDFFVAFMFDGCSGGAFNMNDDFNLPQGITEVGTYFAARIFRACSGGAFNMNGYFNLPQDITEVSDFFAYGMFEGCGASFQVNNFFKFPLLSSLPTGAYGLTLSLGSSVPVQTRTASSIINGNPDPTTDLNTFGPSTKWDLTGVDTNWIN
jgi:hypothetical protein